MPMARVRNKHYEKAPITRAVIEILVQTKSSEGILTALRELADEKAVLKQFPQRRDLWTHQTSLAMGAPHVQMNSATNQVDFELSNLSEGLVAHLRADGLVLFKNAPYDRWETFLPHFKLLWQYYKKKLPIARVTRVGSRYVNRIDIEMKGRKPLTLNSILHARPEIPPSVAEGIDQYYFETRFPVNGSRNLRATMRQGIAASPLPKHIGLTLDIDVYAENPQLKGDGDSLWRLLGRIRRSKNEIFENSLKKATKDKFDQ